MTQLSLAYRPGHVGREAWSKRLEAIRAAVSHLGLKEVSFELDVSGSALSDALNERDRKRWAAEWTSVLLAMLQARHDEFSDDLARAILEPEAGLTAFALEERKELTPEQLAAAYERELMALGKAGEQAISRARRGGRR
ncbi:MAG: hypothetical protein ACTHU0_19310 [Kofleriaceae bacterium]